MKADFHVHTSFSFDSESAPEDIINAAIQKGLRTICITDHHDLDFAEPGWEVNFDKYFPKLLELQEKYKNQIEVLIGMEFGLQKHLDGICGELAHKYPFDFILGSVHLFDGRDPYYPQYFMDKTDEEGFKRGFEITLENVKDASNFDVLGHMDYVVRYGHNREKDYSYKKYADYLDEILRLIIQNGKGIEVNTSGWKYGLPFAHPHQDILKRYKELGGELLTIGSDGHRPEHVAYDFHKVKDYLKDCGFEYYTEFRQRKPYFCALY